MKIVQFSKPGPAEVLDLVEVPLPSPGPGEVLVKAQFIGVGMPDVLIRSGQYGFMPPLPAVPGTEMSGTIEAVGEGVTGLRTGQRVLVSARERVHRGGCYAEYNATLENSVFALPDGVDLQQAAALANYQVAYHLLNDCTQPRQGQSALVYAAAGGVGSALVELAVMAGLDVIAVCSGAAKMNFVKGLGARAVFDRREGDIAEGVRTATDGRGADFIMDPVGGPRFSENLALLARFGLLVSYGRLAGYPAGEVMAALIKVGHAGAVRTFSMHVFDDWPERRRQGMRQLIDWLGAGAIRPPIHGIMPLSNARLAHGMLERGEVVGKLLLRA